MPDAPVTALRLECTPKKTGESPGPVVLGISGWRAFRIVSAAAEPQAAVLRGAAEGESLPAAEAAKALEAAGPRQAIVKFGPASGAALAVELETPLAEPEGALVRIEASIETKSQAEDWDLRIGATAAAVDLLAPASLVGLVRKSAAERSPEERTQIDDFRISKHPEGRICADRIASLRREIDEYELQIPTAMVMEERPTPRTTRILIRGAYNNPGGEVTADTPAVLPAMPDEFPRNRLGLARWLVDPSNPLTARVTMNRLWQLAFGMGIVRTAEDFGVQGEPPTHPELLDWLALEFIRSGWDVKAMLRLLATSSTYRQSSRRSRLLHERDPENRLLARGPRFRLQAEFLRDQALAASGLLAPRIGGPSVRPYHPPGLYEQVATPGFGAGVYVAGKGDELFRRGLYTYWRRSVPNPGMLLFDAPFRESCSVRRTRTNTPLQALNLLNDPTFVEAARALSVRMIRESGEEASERVSLGFRLVLGRSPRPEELAIFVGEYRQAMDEFRAEPEQVALLLRVGTAPVDAAIDCVELAALTAVAGVILNLDETVTKE